MADTPPRRRRTQRATPPVDDTPQEEPKRESPPPKVSAPGKGPATLQRKLEMMIVGMGLPFAAAGDEHCAMVFAQRGPVVAEAWANLANESPAVKRVLESMLKGGAWTGAIGATVSLVMPVAAHHGLSVPNPMDAVVFGRRKEQEEEPTEEPTQGPMFTTPMNGNSNGNGAPGPAAVSVKPSGQSDGLDDPASYPGNIFPDS